MRVDRHVPDNNEYVSPHSAREASWEVVSSSPNALLHMLPCSRSSVALRATFAWTTLVLVSYHIVSHAVSLLFILLQTFARSTSPPFRTCIVLELLQ
jgi:hypothetical protein